MPVSGVGGPDMVHSSFGPLTQTNRKYKDGTSTSLKNKNTKTKNRRPHRPSALPSTLRQNTKTDEHTLT